MTQPLQTAQKPRSFRTTRTLSALMLREMSTTYGKSAFGYLWAIFEPVAGILLLTLIFSIALRSPALGTSFPLFYASGLLPFTAYMDLSGKLAQSLNFSRPLLAFPAVTFIDPILARLLLNGLTQVVIAALVIGGLIVIFQLDVIINYTYLLLAIAMTMSLGFGIGVLNCYLFMRFPAWERIWAIVNRPLFFVSCIFFLFEQIPAPYNGFLWYNPLVHIVGTARKGIYATYSAEYVSVVYVLGLSSVAAVMGLLLLRRHYRDLLLN